MILDRIQSPSDLREVRGEDIPDLCREIRETILAAVAENGGHLASNLGVVELSVALHRVFDSPRDAIIFDVGHQCYAHKILTGRRGGFARLRQTDGMSGFPNREESEHDPFTTGHSGASLSAALGMAEANRLAGSDAWTVAVIGDGSFTNGMIYEAMNGCRRGLKLIIVLNDNEMSISKNVGALSDYFTKIRLSRGYFAFKHGVKNLCEKIPLFGRPAIRAAIHVKEFIKRALNRKNIFENFGLEYLGPVDGTKESTLESVLREARSCDAPCVVHVITRKGSGYAPAEARPDNYHGVSPFDREIGAAGGTKETFSSVFGETMCALARTDSRVCAVTAAMRDGTGLAPFGEEFPERLFDVGIAEEHAVTFACGLARAGMRAAVALYSTFSQRVFDQILHDAALQKLPLTILLDRAGIVPGDGVTHQGLFDVGLFSPIPGVEIFAPLSFSELEEMLPRALYSPLVSLIRYPRGGEALPEGDFRPVSEDILAADFGDAGPAVTILTYGRLTVQAAQAARMLASEYRVRVVRLGRIWPLNGAILREATGSPSLCLIAEEGMRRGGVGEAVAAILGEDGGYPTRILGAENFVPHGDTETLLARLSLDGEGIARTVREYFANNRK